MNITELPSKPGMYWVLLGPSDDQAKNHEKRDTYNGILCISGMAPFMSIKILKVYATGIANSSLEVRHIKLVGPKFGPPFIQPLTLYDVDSMPPGLTPDDIQKMAPLGGIMLCGGTTEPVGMEVKDLDRLWREKGLPINPSVIGFDPEADLLGELRKGCEQAELSRNSVIDNGSTPNESNEC